MVLVEIDKIREELKRRIREVLNLYRENDSIHAEEMLIGIFKDFAREIVPEEKDEINASFSNRVLSFIDGWNYCRQKILRVIEEV